MDKRRFFAEYDALASETAHSAYQFFENNLQRWMHLVDASPETTAIVKPLGEHLARNAWMAKFGTPRAQLSGGQVQWPLERAERLGAQLDLLRIFARGEWDAKQFGWTYLRSSSPHAADIVAMVSEAVLQPTQRELRRYIDDVWINSVEELIPASDRTVTLDHNSKPYGDAIDALKKLEAALIAANDYPDADDKSQRIAEVSAAGRLLASTRVRVGAFVTLAAPTLFWLAEKFAGGIISQCAQTAWDLLRPLLGF